ncbi:FKBP-type peptidyl-prolyl cis-trans isomerase [Daejeonella oryzae]|uniref:FKBP-type peptidyl-prolyl cis-trans isomerase n=1 Tax=Daejeonella oryzae TaxID=1122943 RepID=UPI00040A5D1D|nr:FKBP-type peptidyl-prolyl cis-trans isomerase [Daejeonella oryzae]
MKLIKYTLISTFLPIALFAQNVNAQESKNTILASELKSSVDSASYALGMSIATDLKKRGVTELNYSLFAKALANGFSGANKLLSQEDGQRAISNYLTAASKRSENLVLDEGNQFLKANKTKAGVVTLPSGLQYLILKSGSGPKPKATDQVTVHYTGTLINGKKFDSSFDRNQPLSLSLSEVIPGWTEGLKQMPTGSKYRLFIPWELGYGENGAGEIPPYSVLIFEIELISIGK